MEETWLTGIDPAKAEGSGVANAGVSIDQIAAAAIGQDTPFPSLELKTEPRGGSHCYAGVGRPLPASRRGGMASAGASPFGAGGGDISS